jgi:hypothetical protein
MSEDQRRGDGALTERPLRAYLRDDERLVHVLTNQEVGLERTDGDGETRIRPAPDCGAVAGLTDRRVLFAVGDHSGDFASGVRYTDIADAEARTETLTARLTIETAAGTTWSFSAREADVGPVDAFLTMACEGWAAVDALETHCERLAEFLETGEWDAFERRRERAVETLEDGLDSEASERIPAVGDRIERLAGELYELVRDRHVLAGQEALAAAETRLESESFAASRERVRAARERFQHAVRVAAGRDIQTGPAATGLARAEKLTGAVVGRPWALARERAAAARTRSDPAERIEGLEEAFDAYRTLARLVTGEGPAFSGDRASVRDESQAVIEALIDARLECARERRMAANWEWEAGDERAAYEQFTAARDDLDRALELASSYPPGDAAAVRERRESLTDQFDPLVIRFELAEVDAEAEADAEE